MYGDQFSHKHIRRKKAWVLDLLVREYDIEAEDRSAFVQAGVSALPVL